MVLGTTKAGTFAAGVFGRWLFLFPVLWLAYVVGEALMRCSVVGGVRSCIEMMMGSPFAAVFPAIVHDKDPPIETPHLAILLAAIAASAAWQAVSSRRSRR